MTDPTRRPDPGADREGLEHLLAECLEMVETEGPEAIGRLISENPGHASDLRNCLDILDQLDLVHGSEAADDGLLPPALGDFRPIKRIGVGGMGEVFLAEQTSLGRLVALKIVRPGVAPGSPAAAERFRREALAVARLSHPNIVDVHAYGEHDGQSYIAMEYVPGRGLDELYAQQHATEDAFTRSELLTWMRDVGRALSAAHAIDLVHRDVKPSNIRITPDGRAVLLDFGLARHLGETSLSLTGAFVGSASYAAPEQVTSNRGAIGPATDVYGLGVTLYEGVTGRRPFDAGTTEKTFHRILSQPPPPARRIASQVSTELDTVLARALAKEPEHRYATVAAFADDLAALLEGRPVSVRPVSTATRALRWARREPVKATLAVVCVLAVVLAAVVVDRVLESRAAERRAQVESLVASAFDAYSEADFGSARRDFEAALALDADSIEAHAGLCLTLDRDGRSRAALERLRSRRGLLERSPGLRSLEAAVEKRVSGTESAPADDTAFVTTTALDHFILAAADYGRDTPESDARSLRHARRAVLASDRRRRLFLEGLIRSALVCGDRELAEDALAVLESEWPDSPATWYQRARVLAETDPAGAAREFERFLAVSPDSPNAHGYLANALHALGQKDRALEHYDRAMALSPSVPMFAGNAAYLLAERGDYRGALERYDTLLKHVPGQREVLAGALEVSYRITDWPRAKKLARRVIEQDDTGFRPWWILAEACRNTGELEEALRCFERAAHLDPSYAAAAHQIAEVRSLISEAEKLAAILRGEPAPDDEAELRRLARVAYLKGEVRRAAEWYREAYVEDGAHTSQPVRLYNAGLAALRVGLAADGAPEPLPAAGRRTWRDRAHEWLTLAAELYDDYVDRGVAGGDRVRVILLYDWRENEHLRRTMPPGFEGLEPEEHSKWGELWGTVESILAEVSG